MQSGSGVACSNHDGAYSNCHVCLISDSLLLIRLRAARSGNIKITVMLVKELAAQRVVCLRLLLRVRKLRLGGTVVPLRTDSLRAGKLVGLAGACKQMP
eukprot:SAG31_NODE_7246_length_1744_cov_1.779331_2_plen_99_part_00